MSKMLEIYCGSNAYQTIQEQGFKQELFTTMLGASGGPKWFTLFGLDKFLFGEFFKNRNTELNLVGSSAGAFRFAALCQKDPVSAITRLATSYATTTYSKKATSKEITDKAQQLLDYVLGNNGCNEIINNPIFKAHFLVAKCHGLTARENKFPLLVGLLSSLLLNKANRGLLAKQYQRYIYHHPASELLITDNYNFNSQYQPLTKDNLSAALLASGSIPLVMEAIKNIVGSPKGTYRDGGIIDYHFDLNFPKSENLILYPHFSHQPKAGWFDKSLSRKVTLENYKNVIMLVPSAKFIEQLPLKKIPDRKDFTNIDDTSRIDYWRQVLRRSEYLAESFAEIISSKHYHDFKLIT